LAVLVSIVKATTTASSVTLLATVILPEIFSHTARYLPVTAEGEALAISILRGETAVLKHFQERMPYGLFAPDVP